MAAEQTFSAGNIKGVVKDGQVVVTFPLDREDAPLSASRKSRVVASTRGNIEIPGGGKLGINYYIPQE